MLRVRAAVCALGCGRTRRLLEVTAYALNCLGFPLCGSALSMCAAVLDGATCPFVARISSEEGCLWACFWGADGAWPALLAAHHAANTCTACRACRACRVVFAACGQVFTALARTALLRKALSARQQAAVRAPRRAGSRLGARRARGRRPGVDDPGRCWTFSLLSLAPSTRTAHLFARPVLRTHAEVWCPAGPSLWHTNAHGCRSAPPQSKAYACTPPRTQVAVVIVGLALRSNPQALLQRRAAAPPRQPLLTGDLLVGSAYIVASAACYSLLGVLYEVRPDCRLALRMGYAPGRAQAPAADSRPTTSAPPHHAHLVARARVTRRCCRRSCCSAWRACTPSRRTPRST